MLNWIKNKKLKDDSITYAETLCLDEGCDIDEISLRQYVNNTYFNWEYGDGNIYLCGQYYKLIQYYTNKLKQKKVRIILNTIAFKVDYSNSNYIRIYTMNGDDMQIIKCKYAIITVPLPILKSNKIKFIPPLSAEKQTAS